ncbi:hypothetical protein CYY_010573, partial [Polysphondylium violaceum]
MKDILFYSVWRNAFIQTIIRNQLCKDLVINVSLKSLEKDCLYLSTLSTRDKRENNVTIRLDINSEKEFNEYINHKNSFLVDELYFTRLCDAGEFLNHIPRDISKLTFVIDGHKTTFGIRDDIIEPRFPESITEINIKSYQFYHDLDSTFIDSILLNLPANLVKLCLPDKYVINTTMLPTIPSSLSILKCYTNFQSLMKLRVPPNKVYKDCTAKVPLSSLNQLQNLDWITSLEVQGNGESKVSSLEPVPSHIKSLQLTLCEIDINLLPKTLEQLNCASMLMAKNIFPPTLKHLELITFSDRLEKEVLPVSLTYLNLPYFDQKLEPGVFRSNLKELILATYNHELQFGLLPNTLEKLNMERYDKPLLPFVLPNRLKSLDMIRFNQPLVSNSLPASLTHLNLYYYVGSYECVGPLDNLSVLSSSYFHPSISNVIVNVKDISLTLGQLLPNVSLSNTSIERLYF